MIDLLQTFAARQLVKVDSGYWMIAYQVPGGAPGSQLALAVPSNERGEIQIPAVTSLIAYAESDVVAAVR